MDRITDKLKKLEKFKYPAIVMLIGIGILLFPTGSKTENHEDCRTENSLQSALACTEGVGEVNVILSDNGAVVICAGAENAKTRLDIIKAVSTYTGFSSEKITVLKMSDQFLGG